MRKLAAGLFGRFPSISLDPDQMVAHGAAIQAALKARSATLEEVVLTDVCPYTLGIETSNQYGGHIESGHYLPLIEHPRDQQVNTVLTARLERLYQENLGELREQLGHWAAQFQQILDTQDERRIREARSARAGDLGNKTWSGLLSASLTKTG